MRERFRPGAYLFVASGAAIAVLGLLAMATHRPMIFPSLGPTAWMLFALPLAAGSAPRTVIFGQLTAILCGAFALVVFGLVTTPPDLEDITWPRLGAIILALALTLGMMTWLGVVHGPAAATTLIVALGLLRTPVDLVVMMVSMVVLIVVAAVINRLHGVRTPLWRPLPVGDGTAPGL